ncbi:hypothetical protein E2C01_067664 [Portunus trituberculatus]|uniref:Uncharacterized protein n=1 Tax=Portunus trituberculatus TaxID=210409 RepID=A0A5B7HLM8_PORTR|nr:hypothetical protein [Portunus trituberculatus]
MDKMAQETSAVMVRMILMRATVGEARQFTLEHGKRLRQDLSEEFKEELVAQSFNTWGQAGQGRSAPTHPRSPVMSAIVAAGRSRRTCGMRLHLRMMLSPYHNLCNHRLSLSPPGMHVEHPSSANRLSLVGRWPGRHTRHSLSCSPKDRAGVLKRKHYISWPVCVSQRWEIHR